MEIRRGDILLVDFEPVKESEQGRMRPAIVIQNNLLNRFTPLTIVIPLTSKIYEKEYPSNVVIPKEESSLKNDSTALTNQIRTIDKRRAIKKLGSLSPQIMKRVDRAIRVSLDLD